MQWPKGQTTIYKIYT